MPILAVRSYIASSWAEMSRKVRSGFGLAMPVTKDVRRASGDGQGGSNPSRPNLHAQDDLQNAQSIDEPFLPAFPAEIAGHVFPWMAERRRCTIGIGNGSSVEAGRRILETLP